MTPSELLAFEQRWYSRPGKSDAIRRELRIPEARYYQLLIRAADSAEGIAADPFTARMVRERSERRASARERRAA